LNCQEKINFVNSSQNEGLSLPGIALSFHGYSSISRHSIWFSSDGSFSFPLFWISNFFDPGIIEETWLVEMHIWCIKIGNVLVLYIEEWHITNNAFPVMKLFYIRLSLFTYSRLTKCGWMAINVIHIELHICIYS
jgi:hypothetical protein